MADVSTHSSFVSPLRRFLVASILLAFVPQGCTTGVKRYFRQGLKVGPEYCEPSSPVAVDWIDGDDQRVATDRAEAAAWWTVFNDPVLNDLIQSVYCQNLSLRQAGFRILQARATRNIRAGNLFPQQQGMYGDYQHNAYSKNRANTGNIQHRFYNQYDAGFNMAWELDFWGRFRRGVEAADADLDASVDDFDDVLVTLIGETAATYVHIRTYQRALKLTKENFELQRKTYELAKARYEEGATSELDVDQAMANLSRTSSTIPELEIVLRESVLRLCTLNGTPPEDMLKQIGEGEIPVAPPQLCVGIPAELLERRPDIRRAERLCASQCALIGIAESELYPHLGVAGSIGYSSKGLNNFLASPSFMSTISPEFQWAILNYGRLKNGILQNEAKFKELIANYQQTVLLAQEEVEDGLILHIKSWQRAKDLDRAVAASKRSVEISLAQFEDGAVDFNRVVLVEQNLMQQQIEETSAQGNIALGMVKVYQALGGGWELGVDQTEELRCGKVRLRNPDGDIEGESEYDCQP
ncbi:efflux transporter outer membrane subunit [Schlesneria paludicola]|uniref:efflux transporter outer membrane subunit n=1 Tax=Schlesneria paludicola TaxID=360056 RepID=UPI00029A289F|nr:efflux transporter outer membrane subunit [Schlesneria paludicola]